MEQLKALAASLLSAAQSRFQRRALILAGNAAWSLNAVQACLEAVGFQDVLWVSTRAPEGGWAVSGGHAHKALGREVDAVVFDAYSGFDPDAFGAVTGAIRGGGLLFILAPPLAQWPRFADPEKNRIVVFPYSIDQVSGRFLSRFVDVCRQAQEVYVVEQGVAVPTPEPTEVPLATAGDEPGWRTPDQDLAVEAIRRVATGHRRRPVVLRSDRGRGKSAALGMAAAELVKDGIEHIVVTAPRLDAVEALFDHAARSLPGAVNERGRVCYGETVIEFAPPDELAQTPRRGQLLLVDEAAAIPTPLLDRLVTEYSRIAFATTIHGYEGTGQGFAVRFQKALEEHSRGWRELRLETPIRWAKDDPLEAFVFRALLLDAEPPAPDLIGNATVDACTVERVDRDRLVKDDRSLGELFGLLVLAHYRTRPYDLRYLLDGPNLDVWVERFRGHVVATALVAAEGGFTPEIAQRVWEGRARPHGHMLPESMAAHLGLRDAPRLRGARVVRVAVHPALQGRGLGSRLLRAIEDQVRQDGLDYVGSGFGATVDLLRFWDRLGFVPVRMGVQRGATSGVRSAMVLKPITDRGHDLVIEAHARFLDQFPYQLVDHLRDLAPDVAAFLQKRRLDVGGPAAPSNEDLLALASFAFGRRIYEAVLAPAWRVAHWALQEPAACSQLGEADQAVLVMRVLQRRDWSETAEALGLTGRAQTVQALRRAFRKLLLAFGGADVRCLAERLEGGRG